MGCYLSATDNNSLPTKASPTLAVTTANTPPKPFSLASAPQYSPPMLTCCHNESTDESSATNQSGINETEVDLSHFTVSKDILGLGGFGMVKKVTKITGPDLYQDYALKSMSKGMVLARNTGCAAVMTELKTLIMVEDCEFICRLHYAFQDDANLYMVLDYAPCGDLRYNIRQAPLLRFSEHLSRIFIYQILSALNHCHRRSILHRDVKPENILLYSNGSVKLSDFGVAKILPDIEKCRSTSGTHGYMAPEIYVGDHSHGTPFDWFCSGITLHELLTGRRPFEAARLQKYHTNDPPEPLVLDFLNRHVHLSSACKDFVSRLLNPNPKLRLGSAGGFDSIASHLWFKELSLFDGSVQQLMKLELPHIFSCTTNLEKGSKLNIGREEANALIKRHQETHVISEEVQEVFKNFEYNNRFVSSRPASQRSSISRIASGLQKLTSPRNSVDLRAHSARDGETEILDMERMDGLNIFSRGSDSAPVYSHKPIGFEDSLMRESVIDYRALSDGREREKEPSEVTRALY